MNFTNILSYQLIFMYYGKYHYESIKFFKEKYWNLP